MAVADVPLGTFLSGGVDSSAVTAALSLSGHTVRSFTIGFDLAAIRRAPVGAAGGRALSIRSHVERTVDPSDVDRRCSIGSIWHYDEPFNDYSSVPTYYLCREARRSITVALSGDGADELFAGYRKYQRLVRRAELDTRLSGRRRARRRGDRAPHAAAKAATGAERWRSTAWPRRRCWPTCCASASRCRSCGRWRAVRWPRRLRHYDPYRLVEQLLRRRAARARSASSTRCAISISR